MEGGPFDRENPVPPEVRKRLEEKYALNKSPVEQGVQYLKNIATFDFGESLRYRNSRPVKEIIFETFSISAMLGLLATVFSLFTGAIFGSIAAWFSYLQKKKLALSFDLFFGFLISLPGFFASTLLILVFGLWLEAFPVALWQGPRSVVLPVLALALRPTGLVARMTYACLQDVLKQDYIRFAFAKGLTRSQVFIKHALKNAYTPVLSFFAPIISTLFVGSIVIEHVFAIPGMGKHFLSSVLDRDYPTILAVTIVYGVIFITINGLAEFTLDKNR